ncbi:hypothetical protein L5G28_07620 [Gordonia sp. HY285]|uniref:hypothetical protein n=1 Tax=Gordonia liuliyuniae TaxID=2911517 RepID=UPI001F421001|nr:hypothetical protein [Gordonia liuliyuniae]MCF8610029.1 hypothetical protein [Gordonia liuliyuniae]
MTRPRPLPEAERLRRDADRQNTAYLADPDLYLQRVAAGHNPAPPRPPQGGGGVARR